MSNRKPAAAAVASEELPLEPANKPASSAPTSEECEAPGTEDGPAEGPADATSAEAPLAEAVPAEPESERALVVAKPGRSVVRDLPRVMARMFGTPLLVDQAKLDVIVAALGPRLGLTDQMLDLAPKSGLLADAENDDDFCAVPYSITQDGIALISCEGTLVYKSSWLGALSGMTGYGDVRSAVENAIADTSVKGILLSVDSFGGEANGCFDLCDAIYSMRSQKPIYGVAADNCLSGGYAILSSCSKVFVSRTSGVGSIGVVCGHVDQSAADKQQGLKYTYVYSGDRKLDGNPHMALSADAREAMQAELDRLRLLFAGSVAKYRNLSVETVIATQAAKYFGENGVTAQLADAVGTPEDALAALRADISKKAPAPAIFTGMHAEAEETENPEAAPATQEPTEGDVLAGPEVADVPEGAGASVLEEVSIATVAPVAKEDASASPSVAAEATAALLAAPVVDLAAVRAQVRGETVSHAAEIIELCSLAGLGGKAAEFIRAELSVPDVRKKLQSLRAHASDEIHLHGHILPDAGGNESQAAAAGWATLHAKVRG